MKLYKYLIIGLVILVSFTLIFNYSGFPTFDCFVKFLNDPPKLRLWPNIVLLEMIFRYSPGVSALFIFLTQLFPPDNGIYFFYLQHAWVAAKLVLLISYFLTFFSLIFFVKSLKKDLRMKNIDVALAYFLSVALLLSNLALGFFDLLIAPIFILALSHLFRRKFFMALLFYLLSLSFNWTLFIFAPFFILFFISCSKSTPLSKILSVCSILSVFIFTAVAHLNSFIFPQTHFINKISQIFGLSWLFEKILSYFTQYYKMSLGEILVVVIPLALALGIITISVGFLIRRVLLQTKNIKIRWFFILGFALLIIILGWFFNISVFFTLSFLLIYTFLYRKLKLLGKIDEGTLLSYAFTAYYMFLLFFPGVSAGNLAWLVIFALLIFIFQLSSVNKFKLFLTNFFVFILLFVMFGTTGYAPEIKAGYFNIFRIMFSALFIIYGIRQLISLLHRSELGNINLNWIKYFVILLIILFNISLIPAQGIGSDMYIYTEFNKILALHSDPFYGHTIIDNPYPPLSTVIFSFFTHLYINLIGPEYTLPIKISTATFYIFFVILIVKFGSFVKKSKSLLNVDTLLICLTVFSLSLQSNSLSFTDIFPAPAIVLAVICLYKKKYFLSGLCLGLAVTIKWQPIALIPVFGLTVFNIRGKFSESLNASLKFVLGLILIPIAVWSLVLSYPLGKVVFDQNIHFFMAGPPYFSGVALNLNWIVGYFLHIFQPARFESLASNGWMNAYFGASAAPKIFQGFFFYLASTVILLRYWFSYKKDLPHFLAAATLIYFSHYMLNKGAHSNHAFYFVLMMLMLYIASPTAKNRLILILFDIMNFMNQALFFGLLGSSDINRVFLRVDISVIFAAYYLMVYGIVFKTYFKFKGLFSEEKQSPRLMIKSKI